MSELLLQTIVEKLEAIELLLKHDNTNQYAEVIQELRQEVKKLSARALCNDKAIELTTSMDTLSERLSQLLKSRFEQRVIHKHHLHKGIWAIVVLLFTSIFCLRQWMNAIDDTKQFEANDIKYRALKVTRDKALSKLLFHTDSLYNLDPADMQQWVVQEEERLTEQTKLLQLAGEKEKQVKQLRDRAEKK